MKPASAFSRSGTWLKTYGETVYGTRRGPISPPIVGRFDHQGCSRRTKDLSAYPQARRWENPSPSIPAIAWAPFVFGTAAPLKLIRKPGVLALDLPRDVLAPIDTIIELRPASKPKGR